MALDKKQTKLITKIGIGLVALMLVVAFIPWNSFGFGGGAQDPTGTDGGQLETIASKYTSTIAFNDEALASDPTSYTVLVSQGNTYFDWALEVQQASQTGADRPMWLSAAVYYGRAVSVQPGDPNVATDYAVSLFYSGDVQSAIGVIEPVLMENPEFAVAFYNAGIFYNAAGRSADAVSAMQTYLSLDPGGQSGNPEVAQQVIDANASAAGMSTPSATGTPSATSTP